MKLVDKIKNNKTTFIYIGIIVLLGILEYFVVTRFTYIYGSDVDWLKQHATFPDYFRKLFYETGNLFPDLAMHIGSGQNIFYFSYYGLFNPIIMFSYLLPNVSMFDYIMISSSLCITISTILFYFFLKKNNFDDKISFISSLFIMFSVSFTFHSHRHIMWMSYMPFLILGLIGVIRYLKDHKSLLLVLSISLMILTSYYYSIPGIICICLYALYYYLNINEFKLKDTILCSFKFLLRVFLGILIASLLLLPTIYTLLNGRLEIIKNATLGVNLFLPFSKLGYIFYDGYGMGLTSILWISLIFGIIKGKGNIKSVSFIIILLLTVPYFNYLLNGFLYLNGKVFIPFIPICTFLIANTFNSIRDIKFSIRDWKILGIICIISSFILANCKIGKVLLFDLEMIGTIILLYFYNTKKKDYFLYPILIILIIICCNSNVSDSLIRKKDFNIIMNNYSYDINNYLNKDVDSLYRYQDDLNRINDYNYSDALLDYRTTLYSSTSNKNYLNTFYNIFNNNNYSFNYFMISETNNLFFNRFSGIRYLLTDLEAPFGYTKINDYENASLYENSSVYPIGFVNYNILSYKEFEDLNFNYKLEAFNNNIITDNSINPNLEFISKEIELDYYLDSIENANYSEYYKGYKVISENNGNIVLNLDKPTNKVLIIRFNMNDIPTCDNGDVFIEINGISNKLTCDTWRYYNKNEVFNYVLSNNSYIDKLNIKFSKGNFDISDIKVYEIDKKFFDNKKNISELKVDFNKTKGDTISGSVNALEDGYFIFTIPYDKGYSLYVDGKKTNIEKVNYSYIGFKINKGEHDIKLVFDAPYSNLGILVSMIGLGSTILLCVFEKKKNI